MISIFRRLLPKRQRKPSPRNRNYFRPRLEALEERWCPAADTWMATVNNLWSNGQNWSLGAVPGVNDSATFDGGQQPIGQGNNKPVTVDVTTVCNDVTFQNNYTATMTINAVTLETKNGFNLSNQNLGGTATLDFKSTSSQLIADAGGGTLKNFDFIDQRGTVSWLGPLSISNNAASSSTASFIVGGSLSLNTSNLVTFKGGAGITIEVGGSMVIQGSNAAVLSDNLDGGIIENYGTFTFNGVLNNKTEVHMAFLNHASATIDSGELDFSQSTVATNGYAVDMNGGTFTLKDATTLDLQNGYYQTGGTLTAISSIINLLGNQTKVDIAGGNVKLGTATSFSNLAIDGGDLNFLGGEYDPKINGGASGVCDYIDVTGKITIAAASTLKVTAINEVRPGFSWDILKADSKTINGDFGNKSLAGTFGPNGAELPNGIYQLQS